VRRRHSETTTMKVILNQTVPKVGKAGQVVTVAGGFARNYLFPRGLAVVADRGQLKALEARRKRVDARLAETKSDADTVKDQLHGKSVRIEAKAGRENTKLFGAITAEKVAEAIKEQLGVIVEKKQVGVLEPIKRLGSYAIEIDLHRDVDATVTVEVFDPEAVVVAEQEATGTAEPTDTPEGEAEELVQA